MNDENNKSKVITPENMVKIKDYLQKIEELLPEGLINLTPKQRKSNVKMCDKNYAFIYNGYDFAKLVPAIKPNFVSLEDMQDNLESVKTLTTVFSIMKGMTSRFDDSILYEGGEAFKKALSIYKFAKYAASRNISGAKEVAAAMKKSYPGHKEKKDDETEPE